MYKLSKSSRVDAINIIKRIIYELKPNNPWSIKRGEKQLNRYLNEAAKKFGGEWKGVLKLYE